MIPRWKVIEHVAKRYGAHTNDFLAAAENLRLFKKGEISMDVMEDDHERMQLRMARENTDNVPAALERIMGTIDFQDKNVLDKLSYLAQAVCRILVRTTPIGTGFLISENVIITNHHVLEKAEDAHNMVAEFDYELDVKGKLKASACFPLDASAFFLSSPLEKYPDQPHSGLDFTMVALDPQGTKGEKLKQYRPVYLDGNKGKMVKGENCVIIQHPAGDTKKIVLKNSAFFDETGTRIVYETDTLPGSSGAMVVALGTCEIVALHHAGLPRTDTLNRPLTRSGQIAQAGTPDDLIDWIGNEGIKISTIINALKGATLSDAMQPIREQLLHNTETVVEKLIESPITSDSSVTVTAPVNTGTIKPSDMPQTSSPSTGAAQNLQYFEVLVSANASLREYWELHASELVPGLVHRETLIPFAMGDSSARMEYLTVQSDLPPWQLAQQIENLSAIELCAADLETLTDAGIEGGVNLGVHTTESAVYNDGTAEWNETKVFIPRWKESKWYKNAAKRPPNGIRWWNWHAIRSPWIPPLSTTTKPAMQDVRDKISANLGKLRFVQLDTGYTRHTKSFGAYDFEKDYDFIDDDTTAEDRAKGISSRLFLKFPSHGTRTASLTLGGAIANDVLGCDGNNGLLTVFDKPAKLIPYRISRSVILIGRGKEVINAANTAIQNGTDVMFMCMGSYPRPMFERIAYEAYHHGVIWVCAAGNEVEVVVAPAMYPGTIAVGATNPEDTPWCGSSYGAAVDISAPGEAVYVPFVNKNGNEVMAYGAGTSYATPQVASAAMMWKALHFDALKSYQPWQIVEAFRTCLRKSRRAPGHWTPEMLRNHGGGILDLEALLKEELPAPSSLTNAYEGQPPVSHKDLGIREAAHAIWNALRRKLTGGRQYESTGALGLSPRAQSAVDAYKSTGPAGFTESARDGLNSAQAEAFLRDFFDQQT